jgi:hypothetical protein
MSQIVNLFKMIFVIFFMGTCGLLKFSKFLAYQVYKG